MTMFSVSAFFTLSVAASTTSLLLSLVDASSSSSSEQEQPSYGLDCSFPIFSTEMQDDERCVETFGSDTKPQMYQQFMEGCRQSLGDQSATGTSISNNLCEINEAERLRMNNRQPKSIMNFTSTGFVKVRAPQVVMDLVHNFWQVNYEHREPEVWPTGNADTNHWESATELLSIEDASLQGAGPAMKDSIWDAVQSTIEEWTGMKQRPSSMYGIRIYQEGAILTPHCDRAPLIASAIVNVAQDVDEDWPLEVYDRQGNAVNITMEPGDMVLYESASVIHGRPFPLQGRYFANLFIHFEPFQFLDGRPLVNDKDPDLPPYVLADSEEAKFRHRWYIDVGSDVNAGVNLKVHTAAGNGDIAQLEHCAKSDSTQLHLKDPNGWQPIHEASRMGKYETVKFLVEHNANVNSRTGFGEGVSPLTLARDAVRPNHKLVIYLESIGAKAYVWDKGDEQLLTEAQDL